MNMKWSEQMRELESADQVYHECVVDYGNNNVILNGEIISYSDDSREYNTKIPSKYEKLFFDPFFASRILVYEDENYWHVKKHKRFNNLLCLYCDDNLIYIIAIGDVTQGPS